MTTIKSKQANRLWKENMKGYNGYKNYAQWNQSLWLKNDESLYNLVKDRAIYCRNRGYSKDDLAAQIFGELQDMNISHTPDGVKWSKSGIRAALVGM